MNKAALDKVIKRLHVQQVYLSALSLKVDSEYSPAAFSDPTSSLFAWKTTGVNLQELTDPAGNKTSFVKFHFETSTKIVRNITGKPFPQDYRPSESDIVATIETTFVVDYAVTEEGELDQDGMREFAQHNLPYHVWPYWREQIQNVATRALLPTPMLPFYRVNPKRAPQSDQAT